MNRSGRAPLGSGTDLILFGYRNDVAQARVLHFLDRLRRSPHDPAPLDRGAPLPQRLFRGLDGERAQQMRSQLEQLGAQVALVEAGQEPIMGRESTEVTARAPRPILPSALLLALMLVTAVFMWRLAGAPRRPPAAPAPEVPAIEPAPRYAGTVDEPAVAELNADAIRLAESGHFSEAVQRLHRALHLAPRHPVLIRNLQTMLFNQGVAALNAGRLQQAAEHLQDAAQLEERAEVLRALGVTYLRQGNDADAGPTLEHALRIAPTDAHTMLALAQVYVRREQRPAALDLLHRAKEAGATGSELEQLMQQLSREVDAEWDFVGLESHHFRVRFAAGEDRSAVTAVLDALEQAYDSVGAKLDSYPDERTTAVLYAEEDFHTLTQTPDWTGAVFDGRIKIPVRGLTADDPNLDRVVRHEYAHSLVARLTGKNCPGWLNEGLAMWADETADGEHDSWARERIAHQDLLSFDTLRDSFAPLPAEAVQVAYAQSYLAVRTLIDDYGAWRVPALLTALGRRRTVSDAFAEVYPEELTGFQQRVLRDLAW